MILVNKKNILQTNINNQETNLLDNHTYVITQPRWQGYNYNHRPHKSSRNNLTLNLLCFS